VVRWIAVHRRSHNALRLNGVESVLLTYPQEGHGIRQYPAAIECTSRMIAWFEAHMPPNRSHTR
jgi:dipeptidyl aminopeptidase/acylaminoacyl peptidase